MIYIKNLEDEAYLASYKKNLENRGAETGILDRVTELDHLRKQKILSLEGKKAEQKVASEAIGAKKKKGEDAEAEIKAVASLKESIKVLEKDFEGTMSELNDLLLHLPNHCHADVPVGASEADNVIVRTEGEKPKFGFDVKDHHDLGEEMGTLDFDRAGKVSGTRFTFLFHWAAKLERALMNFMLDLHTKEHGYTEAIPPYLVNAESMLGTGQFPKFQDDVFHIKDYPLYLIPTAETPMTNYFRDEMLAEADLPKKFTAYSSCFRAEAGSYGRDTRGLIRQHQFQKVELMTFCHPETSQEEHEKLTGHAEEVLKRLGLHYRVSALCTGDISFGASRCFDLEVWLPSAGEFREISSCSNFEDFQARRANARFRPQGGGKPQFLHTLNGSGLAIGRTAVAIMENYQQEDGSIRVPDVLKKYMGVDIMKKAEE